MHHDDYNDFADTVNSSFKEVYPGERVIGIVCSIVQEKILVDFGGRYIGYAKLSDLTLDPALKIPDIVSIGDALEFVVLNIADCEGLVQLRLAVVEDQRTQISKQRHNAIADEILARVQDELSAMKPGFISEIIDSVCSRLETKILSDNIALKARVCELENRLLQLERIIDKLKIEE